MCASELQKYLSLLESGNELSRIIVPADPHLEIATITDRVCKQPGGGRALFFERPTGCGFPVATNLFGSFRRVCLALGFESLDELTSLASGLLDQIPEIDFPNLGRQITVLSEFSCFAPKLLAEPDSALAAMPLPDLTTFPFLQAWPEDGSVSGHKRYITLPQVFTTDPDGGTPNCGLYRVQIRGPRELALQWKTGSGAAKHAELYRSAGKKMPVAIVLGGAPATLFSAMFPLPGDLDETVFAGFLRRKPLQMAPCCTVPLKVPLGAELVIEGYLEPGEAVTEGPFGNHTGFYAPAALAPLLRITAIRHRRAAIIPATVVGPPPMEDCWMAVAWERLLLAFLQKMFSMLADIHFPFEWIFHQSAIISLEDPRPGMVREVAEQLWRLPWFASARVLIFVDAASGRSRLSQASWKCINLLDARYDLIADQASARIALDATGCRLPGKMLKMNENIIKLVDRRWPEYGFA